MSESQIPKRTIVRTEVAIPVVSESNMDPIINSALETIAIELDRYHKKATKDKSLDLKEARVVQGYLRTLVELKRQKQQQDPTDFTKLKDDEILKIMGALAKSRGLNVKID